MLKALAVLRVYTKLQTEVVDREIKCIVTYFRPPQVAGFVERVQVGQTFNPRVLLSSDQLIGGRDAVAL